MKKLKNTVYFREEITRIYHELIKFESERKENNWYHFLKVGKSLGSREFEIEALEIYFDYVDDFIDYDGDGDVICISDYERYELKKQFTFLSENKGVLVNE